MTYLAGLQPQVIVWVSPRFREEHLSAIRWLNEHTVDPFAFSAVRLRVVRIGTSPFAPLFEVVEKPNGWDRRVQEVARESRDMSEKGQRRKAFWAFLSDRHPDIGPSGSYAGSSWWLPVAGTDLYVAVYFARDAVGIFVRGEKGVEQSTTAERLAAVEQQLRVLEPLRARLNAALGFNNASPPLGGEGARRADEGGKPRERRPQCPSPRPSPRKRGEGDVRLAGVGDPARSRRLARGDSGARE